MSTIAQTESLAGEAQRLDKWLWFARVVKTRTLATALVLDGKVRLNRNRVDKPSQAVRAGDVITVAVHSRVRILKVVAPGKQRGSATIARTLYEDLTLSTTGGEGHAEGAECIDRGFPQRAAGTGRPTKRDRRALDRLTREDH
jgi:ribosome-associated heat shock protein Hsp15